MTSERIKEIQEETAYPNSVSVQQALLKVWNECEQKQVKNCTIPAVSNSTEIIEKFVSSWRNTDKHPCPKCGAELGMSDYKCEKCNIKLKLKMRF